MKSWIVKGVVGIAVVVGLPIAVLAVLAAQGRLKSPDAEAFRQVPVVGNLLPAASEEEPPSTDGDGSSGPGGDVEAGDPMREEIELLDPDSLVAELRARRTLYDRKLDELKRERAELNRWRAELDDREKILARLQDQISQEKSEVDTQRKRLDEDGRKITELEAKTFKETARMISEMDTTEAASALGDLDETRAAEILRVMEASSAGAVFSEMKDADKRKRLLEIYTRLHVDKTGGGN